MRSDIPRVTQCLLTERLRLLIDCLTASRFYGDRTVRTLEAEALILKFSTRNCIVLEQGNFP
jgi:hypothetical protein